MGQNNEFSLLLYFTLFFIITSSGIFSASLLQITLANLVAGENKGLVKLLPFSNTE